MFQYRQVLVRLRAGDTVREIARSGLMGRDKKVERGRMRFVLLERLARAVVRADVDERDLAAVLSG